MLKTLYAEQKKRHRFIEQSFGLCFFYLLTFGCLSGPGTVLESSKWTVLDSAVLKCKKNASSIVTGPNITGSPGH